jgi:hypothetical protein
MFSMFWDSQSQYQTNALCFLEHAKLTAATTPPVFWNIQVRFLFQCSSSFRTFDTKLIRLNLQQNEELVSPWLAALMARLYSSQ